MDEGDRSVADDEPTERTEQFLDDTDGVDDGLDGVDDGLDGVDDGSDSVDDGSDGDTGDGGTAGNDRSAGDEEVDRPRPDAETAGPSETDETSELNRSEAGIDDVSPWSEGSATDPDESLLYRFRHDREGVLMWIRELLSSVAIVLVVGLILFGVSGVWPPMVAVESGSMEPNMEVGDLVFVTEPGRLAPDAAENDIGVVTYDVGKEVEYQTFGSYGSVVIYRPPGRTASPIIHRTMFRVEEGENWYDRANDQYHAAADCGDLNYCPAPHDGYITLGDNNGAYDQANGLAAPVRAEWVTGIARVRIPYLGYVRLIATGQAEVGDVFASAVGVIPGGTGELEPVEPGGNGFVSGGRDLVDAVG